MVVVFPFTVDLNGHEGRDLFFPGNKLTWLIASSPLDATAAINVIMNNDYVSSLDVTSVTGWD